MNTGKWLLITVNFWLALFFFLWMFRQQDQYYYHVEHARVIYRMDRRKGTIERIFITFNGDMPPQVKVQRIIP